MINVGYSPYKEQWGSKKHAKPIKKKELSVFP